MLSSMDWILGQKSVMRDFRERNDLALESSTQQSNEKGILIEDREMSSEATIISVRLHEDLNKMVTVEMKEKGIVSRSWCDQWDVESEREGRSKLTLST